MTLDPHSTALILIDLQNSHIARQLAPHPAADVVRNSLLLADTLRQKGGTVVFVRVLVQEMLPFEVDAPFPRPATPPPANASELAPEVRAQVHEADILIAKRQWGAFYGTELDQLLRRHGIKTLIMGGIATNFGVESTARAAMDFGYRLLFAEDAMSTLSPEMHRFSIECLFPKMGRVRITKEILNLLG